MKIKQSETKRTRALVLGYLERLASSAFDDYPQQIRELVHGKHGVYALYKGDRLYYVGLATNLRNRVKHHLIDKLAGKWNRFSLYLVRKVEHIKELESLVLRIATPKGNTSGGRLSGADDLATIIEKHGWQLERKFNRGYCGFKAGFFNAFGIDWWGSKTFGLFVKISQAEAQGITPRPMKYSKRWKQAYYPIEPGRTNLKTLLPVFDFAYHKLAGKSKT